MTNQASYTVTINAAKSVENMEKLDPKPSVWVQDEKAVIMTGDGVIALAPGDKVVCEGNRWRVEPKKV